MKRAAWIWAPRIVGGALVVLVLSWVGWEDRVRDGDQEWTGRLVEQTAERAVLDLGDGNEVRITLREDEPDQVHVGLRTAFARLARHPGPLALGVLLHLLSLVLATLRWGVLLRGADVPVPTAQVFRLSWIGLFAANILPGLVGGDVAKAAVAAKDHPERAVRAALSVLADRVIGLLVLVMFVAVMLVFVPGELFGATRWVLFALAFGSFCGVLAVLYVVHHRHRGASAGRRGFVRRVLYEVAGALAQYASRPRILGTTVALSLLGHLATLGAIACYAAALGAQLTPFQFGVAVPAAQAVAAIPLLRGGWGMGESAYYAILGQAGVAASLAVAISVSFRIVNMLLSLPGALFLARVRPTQPKT